MGRRSTLMAEQSDHHDQAIGLLRKARKYRPTDTRLLWALTDSTLRMKGGGVASIDGFHMAAWARSAAGLKACFPANAKHDERYPLVRRRLRMERWRPGPPSSLSPWTTVRAARGKCTAIGGHRKCTPRTVCSGAR